MISTIKINMHVQGLLDMCNPLDIDFSIRFIFPQTQTSVDTKKYKIYVLSVRNDVEYLGYIDDEIRVASGNIHHVRLNEDTCVYAALYGHLDILKYAHENGCPWYYRTVASAAREGHLDILKYAHENGRPWDKWACSDAALKGHLDCLKYAHENGCPWSKYTCGNAAYGGNLDCLEYARDNGCPWSKYTYRNALRNNHQHILEYLDNNNCPRH